VRQRVFIDHGFENGDPFLLYSHDGLLKGSVVETTTQLP
jgi:hypothetical protein